MQETQLQQKEILAEKKENKQKASDEEKEDVSNMEESAQQE